MSRKENESSKNFKVHYKVQKILLRASSLDVLTPPVTRLEMIEFISAIGADRVIAILENDQILIQEMTDAILREANEYTIKLISMSQANQASPDVKKRT